MSLKTYCSAMLDDLVIGDHITVIVLIEMLCVSNITYIYLNIY